MIDFGRIAARAALVRQRCGFFDSEPPYSTMKVNKVCFPDITVTGAKLPTAVLEMTEAGCGRRVLYYNRRVSQADQRVGIMHGFHHHLTDLREPKDRDMRECNRALRELEEAHRFVADPLELACDLFAGEVLVPFDRLHAYAPAVLFPDGVAEAQAFDDEIDRLSSRFAVPAWFMEWRLRDLDLFRRSSLNPR